MLAPLVFSDHEQNLDQRRIQLTQVLDFYGFNWQVWAVAATGFFTDSYNLFATNVREKHSFRPTGPCGKALVCLD